MRRFRQQRHYKKTVRHVLYLLQEGRENKFPGFCFGWCTLLPPSSPLFSASINPTASSYSSSSSYSSLALVLQITRRRFHQIGSILWKLMFQVNLEIVKTKVASHFYFILGVAFNYCLYLLYLHKTQPKSEPEPHFCYFKQEASLPPSHQLPIIPLRI